MGLQSSTEGFVKRVLTLNMALPDDLDLQTCQIYGTIDALCEHIQCCAGTPCSMMQWILKVRESTTALSIGFLILEFARDKGISSGVQSLCL